MADGDPRRGSPSGGLRVRSDFGDVPDPGNFELPAGDATQGQKHFKKHCAQCHSIYSDNRIVRTGAAPLGPSLFDVYGRTSGVAEIQQKTMMGGRATGLVWTAGPLMNYMKNPRQTVDGNIQMSFRGIDDFQTRVDIIHYLKTLNADNEKLAHPPERPSSWLPVFPFNVIGHYLGSKDKD